ncbi:chemotaxis response regulator protein-glutamate methylesterase [Corallincola platygyrae]|uniref:Protein-glutamate methylesterase/protein-glutamine glutaminase n=1 Tax=Corallincola platygyrae TaxID=1193278 RepID=A0ABW4XH06_9GAMM
MAIKVLVVDDSSFFRRRVSEILEKDRGLQVVGSANNGKEAIAQVKKLKPDVITMDIEMPVMDGISAVKAIMAEDPTPILMFSSLTQEGAKATLDALDAGAMDFLPKKFEDIAKDRDEAAHLLQSRVTALGRRRAVRRAAPAAAPTRPTATRPLANRLSSASATAAKPTESKRTAPIRKSGKRYKLVAIGTSTGGPVALQTILTKIPANFPHPIVLIQHMPATFTGAFAQRLNSLCKIKVSEAKDGDMLRPGHAYLAPGGKQMLVDGRDSAARVRIIDGGDKVNYKPCVDVTFAACAKVFGGDVLAAVLTGMGADGRDGARLLKQKGAKIWAQDEKSCVVYGMPQAVAAAGLSEASYPLDEFAERITVEAGHG